MPLDVAYYDAGLITVRSGEQFLGHKEVTQNTEQYSDTGILEKDADAWEAVACFTETT